MLNICLFKLITLFYPLFLEVETNEIYPPKPLITNEAMMSSMEDKCDRFCYKDEKYHTPTGGTVILISSLCLFSYNTFRKMYTGAAKSDQRWRAFSNSRQILVHVI